MHESRLDFLFHPESEAQAHLREAGFPVYPSIGRAARAISKFIQYHEWHQKGRKPVASSSMDN